MGQICLPEELEAALTPLRNAGKTIVSTNGCFDLLHVGHLRYLQAARQLGDVLVLALNSDDSVRRLKGLTRPILPQDERAELLAALNCVDFVVVFDDDTPVELLKRIRPAIHVKGGQYSPETLPETPVLQALGTQLRFIPMIEGRSTSSLIERIRGMSL